VFAVITTRRNRFAPAVTGIVTVLRAAGSKAWPLDAATVVNADPSVLACTDSVWVRRPHEAGSDSTTRRTSCAVPRSTVIDWGNALFVLSQ
jgi:hypothetical protein